MVSRELIVFLLHDGTGFDPAFVRADLLLDEFLFFLGPGERLLRGAKLRLELLDLDAVWRRPGSIVRGSALCRSMVDTCLKIGDLPGNGQDVGVIRSVGRI